MGNFRKRIAPALALGLLGTCASARAADAKPQSRVAEGKYLLESVAMCGDCHTPMTATGPDRTRWLKGGALSFTPVEAPPNWQKASPDLTSSGAIFKQWGETGLRHFLTTGLDPSGNPPNPPMPSYRLRQKDAEAIVEYLKTLK